MTTKIPVELSSTPGIADSSNATAITIDSSENATFAANVTVTGNITGTLATAAQTNITRVGTSLGIGLAPTQNFNLQAAGAVESRFESTDNDCYLQISSDTDEGQDSVLQFLSGSSARGSITYDHNTTAASQSMIFKSGDNAVSAMTILGDGKVGIGTASPDTLLNLESAAPILRGTDSDDTDKFGQIEFDNGDIVISADANSGGGYQSSSKITFCVDSGTERLRIDNSGNVGIGTTSPATTLHLDASGGAVMRLQRTSSNATNKLELSVDGTDSTITSTNLLYLSAGTLTVAEFGTGTSATSGSALVVTNYGNIGFGVRPQYYGSNRYIDGKSGANGECLIELQGHNGSGGKFGIRGGVSTGGMGMISNHTLNFLMNQSSVGTLDTSGVLNIDVNDTSDEGLKENVISIADGTTVIKALRPVAFDWKEITAKNEKGEDTVKPARTGQHGFLAQEVESVLPNAIQGTDWVEGKHFAESKSMNSNAVLAHAVKAIQELEARIATLEG